MEVGVGRGRGRGRAVGVNEAGGLVADLRRPHVSPDVPQQVSLTQSQPQDHTPVTSTGKYDAQESKTKKTSALSADAPEFVPRFIQSSAQPSVQQQVQIANPAQNLQQIHQQVPQPQIHYMCHPVVLQVNNLVVQLTLKPNKFDQVARQLTTIFSWQVQDAFLMKELITVIFEQGVGELNFRYSGARLCQHLSKSITQAYNGPTFKSVLLQRCQEEFEVREVYLASEPSRVCGYTLFLAELFTQLVTSTGHPLEVLRSALCQLLSTLLSQPTDPNLKCVAQVLKFTGSALDRSHRGEMDKVMCQVKDAAMTAPLQAPNTRAMLLSVIELRAANWGRGPPSPTPAPSAASHPALPDSPTSTPTHSNVPLGTVYYGPGGVIQRVEDDPDDSASDNDDPAYYGWSPAVEELEGDVAEAFEEFLRLQQ
ncbi:hypothetical protein Pcinc_015569 [Petrolisthes cinctipes]|uniref:MIF4G domain-containing protein n=1 Tax=Petrolisthes cinctipes TaxID=88211 RepID=A0AAE1FST2_PETCI|nr:hypothetical protein Pcinc_020096 [Petrolisthes cinctipes]KAK3879928.1 hypothetical protein Pcinc_015569 [Petrolisthes cinctipes]